MAQKPRVQSLKSADNGRSAAEQVDALSVQTRRDEILRAAARLFAEFGYESTSVRQIAREVNILSGSLYHHFSTKEEMLHEILSRAVVPITAETVRIAQSDSAPEEQLVAIIILHFRCIAADHELFSILYNSRSYFLRNTGLHEVQQARARGFEALQAVVVDGVERGLFRQEADVYLTIGTIFRMLSGAADWYLSGALVEDDDERGTYSLDAVIDYYLGFILGGLRTSARSGLPVPRAEGESLLAPQC